MAEWFVAGAAVLGGAYLIKQPYYGGDEGVLDDSVKSIPTEGIVKPQSYMGDLTSNTALAAQADMENVDEFASHKGKSDFFAWFNSDAGQADYVAWQKQNGHKGHGVKSGLAMLKAYERQWRSKVNKSHVRDTLTGIHKRTVMQANVVGTNAWDPDRLTVVRNRGNAAPLIATFEGKNTRFTGHSTWLETSPFTLVNYKGIEETPYASDRFGVRTDRDTHTDITPTVATAAPTATASQKVGSVRVRMGDLKRGAQKMGIKVRNKVGTNPAHQLNPSVENAQNYGRILVR